VTTGVDLDRLARLEEERRFLLTSIDDLEREHTAGDIAEDDYVELKDGYIARAAEVIREIESGRAALAPVRHRNWRRTLVVTSAVVAVAVLAGVLLAQYLGQRTPGTVASGGTGDSINTLLSEARALQSTDPATAVTKYDAVLKVAPDNAEALAYKGWLLVRIGAEAVNRKVAGGQDLINQGEQSLKASIAADPKYPDPYCFEAVTRFDFYNDAAGAKAPIDTCLAANPPQVVLALVQGLKDQIYAALASGTTVAGSTTTAG
jgi:hypothetical protein